MRVCSNLEGFTHHILMAGKLEMARQSIKSLDWGQATSLGLGDEGVKANVTARTIQLAIIKITRRVAMPVAIPIPS
jgi:hypothetical protein